MFRGVLSEEPDPGLTKILALMTAANRAIMFEHGPMTLTAMYKVPPLTYNYSALEAVIDAYTNRSLSKNSFVSVFRSLIANAGRSLQAGAVQYRDFTPSIAQEFSLLQ